MTSRLQLIYNSRVECKTALIYYRNQLEIHYSGLYVYTCSYTDRFISSAIRTGLSATSTYMGKRDHMIGGNLVQHPSNSILLLTYLSSVGCINSKLLWYLAAQTRSQSVRDIRKANADTCIIYWKSNDLIS